MVLFCCILFSAKIAVAAQDSNYNEGGATKKDDECPWEGTVAELFTHLIDCKFKPIKCPFTHIGCNNKLNDNGNIDDEKQMKLSAHYDEFNVVHQNLILKQIKEINKKISSMQLEITELRSIILGPGVGLNKN